MKTLIKMPVFIPANLRFRDLIWTLVAIVIVLLVSFLSPSKAGAQNLTVEWDTHLSNSSLDKAASSGKDKVWANFLYFLRIAYNL